MVNRDKWKYPRHTLPRETITIYSMGYSIKEWPRELENELRQEGKVLFCGEAYSLEIHNFDEWLGKSWITSRIYWEILLLKLFKPKYILIIDHEMDPI